MPSLYTFTEYSAEWPRCFNEEAQRLRLMLGEELVDVHHTGSTSVPGLASKPIIDLVPVVRDIAFLDRHGKLFEDAGYKAWGEYGHPGRRFFSKDRGAYRTHNLHCYEMSHPDIELRLAFCAYLRSNAPARREYEALKREAYARHPADISAYCGVKDSWIERTLPVALQWYRQQAHGTRGASGERF